jgi:hypothetical protein
LTLKRLALVCSICRAIPYPCNAPARSSVFKIINAKVPCQTSGLPSMESDPIPTPIGKQYENQKISPQSPQAHSAASRWRGRLTSPEIPHPICQTRAKSQSLVKYSQCLSFRFSACSPRETQYCFIAYRCKLGICGNCCVICNTGIICMLFLTCNTPPGSACFCWLCFNRSLTFCVRDSCRLGGAAFLFGFRHSFPKLGLGRFEAPVPIRC